MIALPQATLSTKAALVAQQVGHCGHFANLLVFVNKFRQNSGCHAVLGQFLLFNKYAGGSCRYRLRDGPYPIQRVGVGHFICSIVTLPKVRGKDNFFVVQDSDGHPSCTRGLGQVVENGSQQLQTILEIHICVFWLFPSMFQPT